MDRKILVGFIMDGKAGGIDRYLLNFLENVWNEEMQIDFLSNEVDEDLKKYLKKYHSRIFPIANLRHPVSQFRQVKQLIKAEDYDMVYLNISTAIDCIAAMAASRCRIPRILLHSHSSGNDCENIGKRKILDGIHYFCRSFLYRFGTEYYGCSKKAGEWMFPKKIVDSPRFHTVFNAIDTKKFSFSDALRREVRKELKIENRFVIGHVGNFCYQKNHEYLLEVFEKLHEKCPEALLLMAGKGPRFEKIKKTAEEKCLGDSVIMTGFRKDVYRLFQAMDFFVLPSNFEGLPTVGVEAQCIGLPCLMSNEITEEARITENCWFMSLKDEPEQWADFILAHRQKDRSEIHWLGNEENYSLEHLKIQQIKQLVNGTD